jgi:hypothetical protein
LNKNRVIPEKYSDNSFINTAKSLVRSSSSKDQKEENGHISTPNFVFKEFTFARIIQEGISTVFNSTKYPVLFPLKVVFQRVLVTCGVFLSQPMYGNDKGDKIENLDNTFEVKNLETNQSLLLEDDEDVANGGNEGVDAEECVICLTDPREVACYPCRHICMCYNCAGYYFFILIIKFLTLFFYKLASMPSVENKCPICRRNSSILIHLKK